jgi:hypothetical protein
MLGGQQGTMSDRFLNVWQMQGKFTNAFLGYGKELEHCV